MTSYSWPISSIAIGGGVAGGIAGSVLFVDNSGNVGQDNTRLKYDITNFLLRLGGGTSRATVNTNSLLNIIKSANNFTDVNIENNTAGTLSSCDIIVGNDSASDTTNYLDLGINSSANTDASYTLFAANEAYLFNQSAGINIGTASASPIKLFTGGTLSANERLRIDSNGNVGIATTAPTQTLTLGSTSTGIALHNQTDQTTNYERGQIFWNANAFTVSANVGGTGTARSLILNSQLAAGAYSRLTINRNATTYQIFDCSGGTGGTTVKYSFQTTAADVPTSGTSTHMQLLPQWAASGTHSTVDLLLNTIQSTAGSGTQRWIDMQINTTPWYTFYRGNGTTTAAFVSSSAIENAIVFNPQIAQTGTAGYTVLKIVASESTTGSGAKNLIDLQTGAGSKFSVDNTGIVTFKNASPFATSVALTNGAGVAAGTLTNAPVVGNPSKWIPINDNGTTRYIPAW